MRGNHSFTPVIVTCVLSFASPAVGQQRDTLYAPLVGRWAEYQVRDHGLKRGQIVWMDDDSLVVRPRLGKERTIRILPGNLTSLSVREAEGGPAGAAGSKRRARWESNNPWDRSSSWPLRALVNRWIRFRVGQGGFQEGLILGVGDDSIVIAPGGNRADAVTVARGELSEVLLGTTQWRQTDKGSGIGATLGGLGAATWVLIAYGPDDGMKGFAASLAALPGALVGGVVGAAIGATHVHHTYVPLEPPFTVAVAPGRDQGVAFTVRLKP